MDFVSIRVKLKMKFGNNFSKDYFAFGTTVQITNVCKYLGIFVDKKLTFKFHIEHVCKKLTKFCGIVWKARYVFSKQQMLRFYKAFKSYNHLWNFNIRQYIPISPYRDNETTKKESWEQFFSNVDMNQLRKLWTKTNCLLFLIYTFLTCLSTCLWNCDRKKNGFRSQIYSQKSGPCTRSKAKGVIKVAKFSTTAKQRSLTVRIVQAFNYLKQNDLIPVNIHEMSEVSCLRLYKQFFQIYLKDNQDLYKLFFNFSP